MKWRVFEVTAATLTCRSRRVGAVCLSTLSLLCPADHDGAEPSVNSVSSWNLLRLHRLLDDPSLLARCRAIMGTFRSRLERIPGAMPELATVHLMLHRPTQQVLHLMLHQPAHQVLCTSCCASPQNRYCPPHVAQAHATGTAVLAMFHRPTQEVLQYLPCFTDPHKRYCSACHVSPTHSTATAVLAMFHRPTQPELQFLLCCTDPYNRYCSTCHVAPAHATDTAVLAMLRQPTQQVLQYLPCCIGPNCHQLIYRIVMC